MTFQIHKTTEVVGDMKSEKALNTLCVQLYFSHLLRWLLNESMQTDEQLIKIDVTAYSECPALRDSLHIAGTQWVDPLWPLSKNCLGKQDVELQEALSH